tara:strand:- start:580 stop:1023 length:444 start_codon:yes stop_codon:yes gene_type:complete
MKFWCSEIPLSSLKHKQDNVETPCLITGWSYIHLITSGFLYLILMYNFKNLTKLKGFLIILFLHTLYEIKDLGYYFGYMKQTEWHDNSLLNCIGDTLACIIGILLIMKFVKPINKKKIWLVGSITILSVFSFMVSSGYLTFLKKTKK